MYFRPGATRCAHGRTVCPPDAAARGVLHRLPPRRWHAAAAPLPIGFSTSRALDSRSPHPTSEQSTYIHNPHRTAFQPLTSQFNGRAIAHVTMNKNSNSIAAVFVINHLTNSFCSRKVMQSIKSLVATLCLCLLVAPISPAQDRQIVINEPQGGWLSSLRRPYEKRNVAPIDLSNSNRLEALLRTGKIYLSLQDAIALALEHNLDIA